MATGSYDGKGVHDPSIRAMFTRGYLLKSGWYRARLKTKQLADIKLWQRHLAYIEQAATQPMIAADAAMKLADRKALAEAGLATAQSESYVNSLVGTLGVDPSVAAI
jgi:hypothetical protein